MAKSALLQGLRAAAAGQPTPTEEKPAKAAVEKQKTVLVGAHFKPQVRKTLLMVQAKQVGNRNLKQLLGEAINDLCAKYNTPEPYDGEE
jgi:hypothetical protein